MNKSVLPFLISGLLVASACSPSQGAIQTALAQTQAAQIAVQGAIETGIAQTQEAMPTIPPPTETALPSSTPEPTSTSAPTKTPPPTETVQPTATKRVTADTSTWPEGFSQIIGRELTISLQYVLMDPDKYGFRDREYNKLKAIELEHPEYKDFIEYILKLGWTF